MILFRTTAIRGGTERGKTVPFEKKGQQQNMQMGQDPIVPAVKFLI